MTSNNTFSFQRLTLLLKQNFLHHYKLFGIYVAAFAGGVFILLLLVQMADEFRPQNASTYFGIFIGIFVISSVLATGTAFPNLRSKEKALTYLLLPASVLEKLVAEILLRVILFMILVPTLYWLVFGIENSMITAISSDYQLIGHIKSEFFEAPSKEDGMQGTWYTLFVSLTFLMFIVPFTGSTIFAKNPLIKTLFSLAIIVVFNVFLVYFFVEIMGYKEFYPRKQVLFITDGRSALNTATIVSIIFNLVLLTASYFKLKEREV